jgi:hypothetical protein
MGGIWLHLRLTFTRESSTWPAAPSSAAATRDDVPDGITLVYSRNDQRIVSAVSIPRAHVTLMTCERGADGQPVILVPDDVDYVSSTLSCKPSR